jgi:hypothetical protein
MVVVRREEGSDAATLVVVADVAALPREVGDSIEGMLSPTSGDARLVNVVLGNAKLRMKSSMRVASERARFAAPFARSARNPPGSAAAAASSVRAFWDAVGVASGAASATAPTVSASASVAAEIVLATNALERSRARTRET